MQEAPETTTDPFACQLAEIIDGRWFPGQHLMVEAFDEGGYTAVSRRCTEALAVQASALFSTSWDAYRAALADVKAWAEAQMTDTSLKVPEVGQMVRLVYPPQMSDQREYVGRVVLSDGDDFDVCIPDGDCWTVLGLEQTAGTVHVEVQS